MPPHAPGDEDPFDKLERLANEHARGTDAEILAKIAALPPLADEDALMNGEDAAWQDTYLFLALGNVARQRKLRPAARLLLERASHGDAGETMRILRHTLEAVYDPDWAALAELCVELSTSSRAGTRLWAVDELGRLRVPSTEAAIRARLDDESRLVREAAQQSLEMLGVA